MTLSPPATGPGTGHLEVKLVHGLSTVTSACARSPLFLRTPRRQGQSVWVYQSSLGGGLVAGDETRLSLKVGQQTRCFLTTQASTKVYRNSASRPCRHLLESTLKPDSILVLAPDPVQPFAGANYTQSQKFHLAPGSGLVLVDWLCSGRVARGERWAFARFHSRTEIFVGADRMLLESLLLDSADGPLVGLHRLGRFNCLALLLVLGEPLLQAAARLVEQNAAQPIQNQSALIASASPIKGGALLRFAGDRMEDVVHEVHRSLSFVPDLIGDDPWMRKW